MSVPLAAVAGAYVKGSWQALPVLTLAQEKLVTALLQPLGKDVRSEVTSTFDAGLPSSVVKDSVTVCDPAPTTALICPLGEAVPTTVSCVVAA